MFPWDSHAKSSLRSTYPGHLSPAGWSRTMDSEGSTHCTILTPGPSRPHSPPCVSSSHWTGVWEAQSAAIFPQEPSCNAMKISQLCFLATLLTLLGTLMTNIPGCEPSNQAQGKSRLILPLWRQGMTGVHGRGWVAWVGWVLLTTLDFFWEVGTLTPWKLLTLKRCYYVFGFKRKVSELTLADEGPHHWNSSFLDTTFCVHLSVV